MSLSSRALPALLLTLLVALVLAGCKRGGPRQTLLDPSYKVVMLSARGSRAYTDAQRQVFSRLVSQNRDWEVEILDAGLSPDTQRQQLEAAIAQKPFAVLLDPLSPTSLKTATTAARDAGIFLIGLGQDSKDLGCDTVLTADQRHLGWLAGDLVLRALFAKAQEEGRKEAQGRVVEIRGDETGTTSQKRHEGFEAALKAAPGIILVHDAPGDWTELGGQGRTQDALRLQHPFDVIYAHDDWMASGAASALADKRNDVMIIGTDGFRGPKGGLTLVGDGEIDATVYQPLLVDFAWQLLQKKAANAAFVPKEDYELKSRTILPKDVDDIRRNGLPPLPEL